MKPSTRTTRALLLASALAALSTGCTRIVAENAVAGLYDTALGSATGIINEFFADRFGFEPEEDGEQDAEAEEEGNDLHIRI